MTDEMTMIERVARRMFETDWPRDNWDRFGPKDYAAERYRAMARAAIEAMREPTQAMLAATEDVVVGHDDFACGDGAIYLSYAGGIGSDGFYEYAIAAHHAMIDAALNETA